MIYFVLSGLHFCDDIAKKHAFLQMGHLIHKYKGRQKMENPNVIRSEGISVLFQVSTELRDQSQIKVFPWRQGAIWLFFLSPPLSESHLVAFFSLSEGWAKDCFSLMMIKTIPRAHYRGAGVNKI